MLPYRRSGMRAPPAVPCPAKQPVRKTYARSLHAEDLKRQLLRQDMPVNACCIWTCLSQPRRSPSWVWKWVQGSHIIMHQEGKCLRHVGPAGPVMTAMQ